VEIYVKDLNHKFSFFLIFPSFKVCGPHNMMSSTCFACFLFLDLIAFNARVYSWIYTMFRKLSKINVIANRIAI
jgi:hypothetical protein